MVDIGGQTMRDKLMKIGRFAYLLPYPVLLVVCLVFEHEDLALTLLLIFLAPWAIESFLVFLIPVCWIISVACFILCGIHARKNKSRQEKAQNTVCGIISGIWAVIRIAMVVWFFLNITVLY